MARHLDAVTLELEQDGLAPNAGGWLLDPLGSSWAVGFQMFKSLDLAPCRLTAEPQDWNGTLEPWNPGTAK